MHSTTVAVDLAKSVFEPAIADEEGKITERLRLNRTRFCALIEAARCGEIGARTFEMTGVNTIMGPGLAAAFISAALPQPESRTDRLEGAER
jgi:hypothetical protein